MSLMICPQNSVCFLGNCSHKVPHDEKSDCSFDAQFCPACIPYVEPVVELKEKTICAIDWATKDGDYTSLIFFKKDKNGVVTFTNSISLSDVETLALKKTLERD